MATVAVVSEAGNGDGQAAGGESSGRAIRLAIVDDDALVRAGLAMILRGATDLEIVAQASDGAGVEALVEAHRVDVVLMDIRMPGVDGLTATERLQTLASPPQVIVLTTFDMDEYVLRALRAGASGFLLKDTPPVELLGAVRRVAAGDTILSPSVVRRLIAHVITDPAATARRDRARCLLDRLTDRERDVALAIGQGLANAEIASGLYMSVATVKTHVSRLLTKLDLTNRVQIALLVHDAELT